jgi:hypothetical protein
VEALTGPMTPPGKRVRLLIRLEVKRDLALLQHKEHLLPMKLMFLNIVTNRKGVEGPANIWRLIRLLLRKNRY